MFQRLTAEDQVCQRHLMVKRTTFSRKFGAASFFLIARLTTASACSIAYEPGIQRPNPRFSHSIPRFRWRYGLDFHEVRGSLNHRQGKQDRCLPKICLSFLLPAASRSLHTRIVTNAVVKALCQLKSCLLSAQFIEVPIISHRLPNADQHVCFHLRQQGRPVYYA